MPAYGRLFTTVMRYVSGMFYARPSGAESSLGLHPQLYRSRGHGTLIAIVILFFSLGIDILCRLMRFKPSSRPNMPSNSSPTIRSLARSLVSTKTRELSRTSVSTARK